MARILVIDDNDGFREPFCELLEKAGYEVVGAANGKVGIELYKREPADLVITDVIMPEKEGIETISELRQDFPDVKIIAISGGGVISANVYLKTVQSFHKIKHVFSKPFSMDEMLQAIKEILG